MQLHEFLGRVQQTTQLDREGALNATRATLETLSERILGGEPLHLGSQLPQSLRDFLHEGRGERFSKEEFFQRVAQREGCSAEEAREHVEAVLQAVAEAVSPGEIQDVMAQLPEEYRELFARQGKTLH